MYLNTAVGEEELVLNASCNVSVSIISAGFRFCGCQYITGLDKHHQNKFQGKLAVIFSRRYDFFFK